MKTLTILSMLVTNLAFAAPIYPGHLNVGIDNDKFDGSIGVRIEGKWYSGLPTPLSPIIKVPVCSYNPESIEMNRNNPDTDLYANDGRECGRNAALRVLKNNSGEPILATELEMGTPIMSACQGEEGHEWSLDSLNIKKFDAANIKAGIEAKLNSVCEKMGGSVIRSAILKEKKNFQLRKLNPGSVFNTPVVRRCHDISMTVLCDFSNRKDEVIDVMEDFITTSPDHASVPKLQKILKDIQTIK